MQQCLSGGLVCVFEAFTIVGVEIWYLLPLCITLQYIQLDWHLLPEFTSCLPQTWISTVRAEELELWKAPFIKHGVV